MTSGNTPQNTNQTPETTSGNAREQREGVLATFDGGEGSEPQRYMGPPTSAETSATCPRCGAFAYFGRGGEVDVDRSVKVTVLICAACKRSTIVIEEGQWIPTSSFGGGVVHPLRPLLWWPFPGGAGSLPPNIGLPAEVVESYDEGVRCLSVQATHGAVANFRTALAHVANDKGDDRVRKERQLGAKLKLLRDNPLLSAVDDYTAALLMIGNAGAHQEDFQPVSMEQATDTEALIRFLIYVLYEVPAQARRMVPTRK